jgi:hypothetical protein
MGDAEARREGTGTGTETSLGPPRRRNRTAEIQRPRIGPLPPRLGSVVQGRRYGRRSTKGRVLLQQLELSLVHDGGCDRPRILRAHRHDTGEEERFFRSLNSIVAGAPAMTETSSHRGTIPTRCACPAATPTGR